MAAVALAVVQGSARFGVALADAARAQSVADAVALALAAGASDVVEELTSDPRAVITDVEWHGSDEVTVRVEFDGRSAMARAAGTFGAADTP